MVVLTKMEIIKLTPKCGISAKLSISVCTTKAGGKANYLSVKPEGLTEAMV
jgi:hypothetical protein